MREIKFRVWDHQDEIMIHPEQESENHFFEPDSSNGILRAYRIYDTFDSEGAPDRSTEEIEIMQYTGLKDKKGEEIYEGDIVEFDNKCIVKIMWGNKKAAWCSADKDNTGSEFGFQIHCRDGELPEIIGNIHEHSHLLDGE